MTAAPSSKRVTAPDTSSSSSPSTEAMTTSAVNDVKNTAAIGEADRKCEESAKPICCNILIVDDEPSNLLALEAILEPLGQQVIRAASGIEALKHALKMELAVVLLDVQMPEMDGLETASLLRKRTRTRDVPIIFLTAISKDKQHVSRGYDVGAVDYLFKPYDPDTLRTKVATFVDLARKNALIRAQHEALRLGSQRELADFKRWSERRYEDLADSMQQVVWTADETGAIKYRNRRWEEIATLNNNARRAEDHESPPSSIEARAAAAHALLASPRGSRAFEFEAIAHPDDLASFAAGWSYAMRAGVEWEAELRIGAPLHGYRFHLVRAIPRREENGGSRIAGWVGTATDIDARVRADRALRMLADASHRLTRSFEEPRELEAVLRTALPVLGDAAILGVRGNAENGAAERIRVARAGFDDAVLADPRFDLGPATVVYSGRAEVFFDVERENDAVSPSSSSPNPSGRGSEHLRFLAELGVSAYICVPLVTHNRTIGTLTFVRLMKGERFAGADVEIAGDLARRVAVSIDNARLHATSEKRREELELANQSKDVFLATLSHELRTPLNAIVGWTDMMKKGALRGDELMRAMETIDRNAHALSGLVADLLDVSRIVTGTLKLESKHVSLASIVEGVVVAARPQCTVKKINLDFLVEPIDSRIPSSTVLGDSGRLRQIITNLLSNAIKFTPPDGTVTVRVSAIPEAQRVRVVVSDSGEGIAPEFLPHVFERFRQQEIGRAKGLGLGLAIVKHLVEEHGGSVSAQSGGLGTGATFTVDLPLAADADEADAARAAAGDHAGAGERTPHHDEFFFGGGAARATTNNEPNLNGVHVLIVEDDPDGNELICTILERYGARVTSTMTAGDALHLLEKERPQVLVSDIGLPDQDGMALIRLVRAKEWGATIPAVALTAYASRQDATKAIAAGFDAHVAKPVQPSTLGSVIVRLLRTRGADNTLPPPETSALS